MQQKIKLSIIIVVLGFLCFASACNEDSGKESVSEDSDCITPCDDGEKCIDGECWAKIEPGDDENRSDDEPEESGEESNNDETDPESYIDIGEERDVTDDEQNEESTSRSCISVSSENLQTTTLGGTDSFTVVLDDQPLETATLSVPSSNPELGMVEPGTLTFTADNWNTPQTITVKGRVNDIEQNTEYQVIIGSESITGLSGCESVQIMVTQVKEEKPDANIPVESFELQYNKESITKLDVLRGGLYMINAVFSPSDATDQKVTWSLDPADDSGTIFDSGSQIAKEKSYKFRSISSKHRTVTLIATHEKTGLKKEITLNIMPYLDLGLKYPKHTDASKKYTTAELRYYKDFERYSAYYTKDNDGNAVPKNGLGDIQCNSDLKKYDEELIQRMNSEMYLKFIRPKMYKKGSDYYGTRASVVAAARFLVLQFPYDIPYIMWGVATSGKNKYPYNTSVSHYATAKGGAMTEKSETAASSRIYGLNLGKKMYSDRNSQKAVRSDAIPWGCAFHVNDEKGDTPNGLECGGFVTWALRNGGMRLGDWSSGMFASYNCSKTKRNYQVKSYVNYLEDLGVAGFRVTTANNVHDLVYTKLNLLKDSDFKPVSKLKPEDVKAGDILWRRYEKGTCGQKSFDHAGHIALVIGVKSDKNGDVTSVCTAEASSNAGNNLRCFGWEYFTQKAGWGNPSKGICGEWDRCESYLIQMDNVYRYKNDKAGVDLNTYGYEPFWQ